jgi:hypothetical protein
MMRNRSPFARVGETVPSTVTQHTHTEYVEKDDRRRENPWLAVVVILLLLLCLVTVGLFAWSIVHQVRINNTNDDVHKTKKGLNGRIDELNTTIVDVSEKCEEVGANLTETSEKCDQLNNSLSVFRKAILSKVSLTPSSALVTSTENFPFDNEQYDPYDLFNTTSHEWTADRDGWWHFLACVTFDRASTPGFDSSISHDHQLQVYINNGITTQGLFAEIYTHHGHDSEEPELPQQAVCGTNTYQLSAGDTLTLRVQTRLRPFTILVSSVDGGPYVATRATLYFIGESQ